ncbi:MAG: protein kinase [Thermoleophilia bacterium]|nr:protein kinase [Thermoleophilia bacterium]
MTDLLAGRYELRARIARGGMGIVWRAYDGHLKRDVAVKLLHPWIAEDAELRRRFAREAQVLAPLEHEHIVRLYDYGEDGEGPFLVMEYVDGASLGDVARGREWTWDEVSEIARPIASALTYAHARGIVHRDLTPGNILIERATGRVVVSDFGLARIARSSTSVMTQGMLLGTPEYWSPEQARGLESETATDLYALGCLLFWLLAGRTPFEGDDRLAVGLRRAHEAAPSLATFVPDAPRDAVATIDALLSVDPSERPTALEVLDLLGVSRPSIADAAAVAGDASNRGTAVFGVAPVTVVLEAPTRHAARKRRRGRRMVALVVAIAAAGALAFVGATIANADRVVDVPRVTGMTMSQARVATAAATHVDVADAPLVVGGRLYSESVPDGRIVSQVPAATEQVDRRSFDLVVRVSRGTAFAEVPDVEGAEQQAATAALRTTGFAIRVRTEESWEIPEGRVISSDVEAGAEARRPGPIGIVVSSGAPRAPIPDVRGTDIDDATARLDGSFDTDVVTEGSTTVEAGTVLRQEPAPGARAVLGSTVTLTVARALAWETAWSESGSGDFDSQPFEVTVPQGDWRIVVELDPRYLIFGSGSAAVSWEGNGSGQIALDRVGSDEVSPLSGAGTYTVKVRPRGSVNWTVRIEQLG